MESGDFKTAGIRFNQLSGQLEPEPAKEFEKRRSRFAVDPVAIAVMIACGCLLAVVAAVTLFH